MAIDDVALDDKAKRMRDLLSSFYNSPDPSSSTATAPITSNYATLDTINSSTFNSDLYMNLLVEKSNVEGLLHRHVEMATEIKNLDTDLQMLVYENYNKFICATDTIKRMKNNIVGMEVNMEQLLDKILSVQSTSDRVNTSLFQKRQRIEKLHRTRNLLRKVQFIYDLPTRLGKCIKTEAYADAVRFYNGAMPIFKVYRDSSFQDCKRASEEVVATIIKNLQVYRDSSFQDCKRASEEVVATIIKNLQGKVFSNSESIQGRAEAVLLLKQLDFPVESLKAKLLEKLEQSVADLQVQYGDISNTPADSDESFKGNKIPEPVASTDHEVFVREFAEAIQAYKVIFPDSEQQLIKLAQDLFRKHFEITRENIKQRVCSADVRRMFRIIWTDVEMVDEVLPESALPDFCSKAAQDAIKDYVGSTFSHLLLDITDSLAKVQTKPKEGVDELPLQSALETSKKQVIQGSMDALLDLRQLLDDNLVLLVNFRGFIIDWVQEGFQDFFRRLNDKFLFISGRNNPMSQNQGSTGGTQGEKALAGLILVLSQLSVFIEQTAIPRITEEIAASFSGVGVRGYEHGPAFVPGEICRIFRLAGETFLHLYINTRTQKISNLLRKRFTTPNWAKHKEPREVHMFVDLFLQELKAIQVEAKQILPQGISKHRRSNSNGSTTSSRSNPLRDDKMIRSNTQRGRSQLLESHLAKLFKQKMEIFTKVEYTQDSVLTTAVKLCLKSLQEFVRLQTFNRSGFQQIQLDIQYLRTALKEIAEDEAVIDFLLDEVIVSASERCLDVTPLEPPILDKLIQAKLAKEQNPSSS